MRLTPTPPLALRSKGPLSVGLLLLLLAGAGCQTVQKHSLTYKLWDTGDLSKWSEPAPDPHLALFQDRHNAQVLVQYDAFSERHTAVKRQAYLLQPNQALVEAGKPPQWAPLSLAEQMEPVRTLPEPTTFTNRPPKQSTYAVVTKEGRAFLLYQPGASPLGCDLPVYEETSGTPARVALTPLAVVGDTAMVAGVLAVIGFIGWLEVGAPVR
jgi:hypothetical protein